MLGWRLFLSAIIVPSLVGLMVWDARLGAAAPVLFVLCWLIGLRASWELLALVKQRTGDPRFLPVAVCVTILMLATWGATLAVGDQFVSSGMERTPRWLRCLQAVSCCCSS
ncbi:MAG: hypothetical protein R3B91_02740 [Planctomycetaceae bacterium]